MQAAGIFIIHGTFGSPHEYTPLIQVLENQGIRTCAVSLPGHGDTPVKMLHEISGDEILAHCLDSFSTFAAECDELIILGHSLGGMCALITAAECESEKLKGVISLSSPYEHAYFVNYPWGFLNMPMTHLLPGLLYAPQSATSFKSPAFMPWWFPRLYQEANRMLGRLQQQLPTLDLPVFLAHSPYDLIVPYREMSKIANRINKPHNVSTYVLDECGHQIYPSSRASDAMTDLILNFIDRHMNVKSPIPALYR